MHAILTDLDTAIGQLRNAKDHLCEGSRAAATGAIHSAVDNAMRAHRKIIREWEAATHQFDRSKPE